MAKWIRRAPVVAVSLLLIRAVYPRHCWYVDGPVSGHVVDSETGEPIWNAAVVEMWRRDFVRMDGGPVFHAAQEALTDLQGRFELPRRSGISPHPFSWIVAPTLLVFRPGYAPCGDSLSARQECPPPVIRLRRLKADERRRAGTPSTVCPPQYSACPRYDIPGRLVPETTRLLAGESMSVREGDTIAGGWTIAKLSPEGASLRCLLPKEQAVLLRLEGKQLVDGVETTIAASGPAAPPPRAWSFSAPHAAPPSAA